MKVKDLFQEENRIPVAFPPHRGQRILPVRRWQIHQSWLLVNYYLLKKTLYLNGCVLGISHLRCSPVPLTLEELSIICTFQLGRWKKKKKESLKGISSLQYPAMFCLINDILKASIPSIITLGDPQTMAQMIQLQLKVAVFAGHQAPEAHLQSLAFADFFSISTLRWGCNADKDSVLSVFPLPTFLLSIWSTL